MILTLGGDHNGGWDTIWVLRVIGLSTVLELDAVHQFSGVDIVESFRAVVSWCEEHFFPQIVEVVDTLVKVWIFDSSSE